LLCQLVGPGDNSEVGRQRRVPDPQQFQLDAEDSDLSRCVLVEPLEHGQVFGSDRLSNPHHHGRLGAGHIRQELAQVVVIGAAELILDGDNAAPDVHGQDVQGVSTDWMLDRPQLKTEPERLAQLIKVGREPGCEVLCLVWPAHPQRHALQLAERHIAAPYIDV